MIGECDGGDYPASVDRVGALPDVRPSGEDRRGSLHELRPAGLVDQASALVDGDRQAEYGEPVEHMRRVAKVWSVILSCEVDAHKVALALAALKLVREAHKPGADNRVDAVGYLEIADRCAGSGA